MPPHSPIASELYFGPGSCQITQLHLLLQPCASDKETLKYSSATPKPTEDGTAAKQLGSNCNIQLLIKNNKLVEQSVQHQEL